MGNVREQVGGRELRDRPKRTERILRIEGVEVGVGAQRRQRDQRRPGGGARRFASRGDDAHGGRGGVRRLVQQHRQGDQGHGEHDRHRQQLPLAQVGQDASEEVHWVTAAVGGVTLAVSPVGATGGAPGGPLGVAPAVAPCSLGTT